MNFREAVLATPWDPWYQETQIHYACSCSQTCPSTSLELAVWGCGSSESTELTGSLTGRTYEALSGTTVCVDGQPRALLCISPFPSHQEDHGFSGGFHLRSSPSLSLSQAVSAMDKYQRSSNLEPGSFRQTPPLHTALLWVFRIIELNRKHLGPVALWSAWFPEGAGIPGD